MCMSDRYFDIKDKTHFSCVFGYFLVANIKKKFQTIILETLSTMFYYKQHIADGRCFDDGP